MAGIYKVVPHGVTNNARLVLFGVQLTKELNNFIQVKICLMSTKCQHLV